MQLKRSIGAVVVVEIPDQERKAVLQIRESTDSFPHCAQLTVHGGAKENEKLRDALSRESHEELGELFQRAALPIPPELELIANTPPEPLHVIGRATTKKERVASLQLTIRDPYFLHLIQPLIDAGIIRLVTGEDVHGIITIDPRNAEHKQNGVGSNLLGMFADERQVLERIFTNTK